MTLRRLIGALALFAIFAFAAPLHAAQDPDWMRAVPPFRIAGNLYYVGSADLASYLVATPQGLILINSDLKTSAPLIRKSVEALGFHFADIKILLISHAHSDHCGGSAEIVRLTGAKYFVMDADAPVVESGGKKDFQYGAEPAQLYPPAHVDRVLHDNDKVHLGGAVLTAHLTAGHTKGTTTWTMDETQNGRVLHVVIVGGPFVGAGYKLVHNAAYPQIAADYEHGFSVLESLPCDIFLGAHGMYFGLKEKSARWQKGDQDAFIDPAGYKSFVADTKQQFEAELQRQSAAKR